MTWRIITVLTRVRLTVWRRTPNFLRWLGVCIGVSLALGTFGLADSTGVASGEAGLLLAGAFAAWLAGWLLGPVQTGGNDFLRPEWFARSPVPPGRLATGLLAAGAVGVGAVITLIASLGLVVHGLQFGPAAALVGLPAALLQVAVFMTASKLVAETLGAAAKSRITLEITAAQLGLFVAAMLVGWFVVWFLFDLTSDLGAAVAGLPPAVAAVVWALPSGWGVAAVEAAGRGDWLLATAALTGLVLLVWLGLSVWGRLLVRRTSSPAVTGATRPRGAPGRRVLPNTPLGATVSKELRGWWRDPRRGVEVRSALWAAFFLTLALWWVEPASLPFAGVLVLLLGSMPSVNAYAMDGTALWRTLLVPGGERVDVRGRQLAWLLVFAPAAVLPTVLGLVLVADTWQLPWVLALLPAMLGGAAGLIPWLSVVALAPETDAHKRGGNPAENGGAAFGAYMAVFLLSPVCAVPAAGFLAAGTLLASSVLLWTGVLVGAVTGACLYWGLGVLAIRRLRSRGPELLQLMRVGPPVAGAREKGPKEAGPASRGTEPDEHQAAEKRKGLRVLLVFVVAMLSLFPQGVVPLLLTLQGADAEVRVWFVARYLPTEYQVPGALVFIALGLALALLSLRMYRRKAVPRTDPAEHEEHSTGS